MIWRVIVRTGTLHAFYDREAVRSECGLWRGEPVGQEYDLGADVKECCGCLRIAAKRQRDRYGLRLNPLPPRRGRR